MDLDSRIIEGKSYLDCFDTEIGKKFIGKECYLSDGVASFANIDNLNKATLIEVDDGDTYPYKLENTRWHYESFFILPCEWVKEEKEKKYRPFTLDEFVNKYSLGDEIILKIKANNKIEHKLFIEYIEDANNINARMNICLGGFYYSLKELFDKSELYTSEGWKPFGVEE